MCRFSKTKQVSSQKNYNQRCCLQYIENESICSIIDAKGNLHLKFKLVNNSYGKITNVSKFKVSVKDSSNKSFVSYSKNNFKTNVASYRDKDCTIIIPKSALKKSYKKIDLRIAKISISGNFASASL